MTARSSRDAVLAAARRLFTEHRYDAVTIRQVAAAAGVSPALVMKLVGSKENLYLQAAPPVRRWIVPTAERRELGPAVVRAMLEQRHARLPEPFAQAILMTDAPPEVARLRDQVVDAFVGPLAAALGGGEPARRTADLVFCALLGLSLGRRRFGRAAGAATDDLVRTYGAMVQALLDDLPG